MSRSGYSDDGDCDGWELIRWRGAVESAIRGKRGQSLLKEMEAALLALPEKRLCAFDFADPSSGEVCALGAVALKRKMDSGKDRKLAIRELSEEFPYGSEADAVSSTFGIADALAREITYVNDEDYDYSTPEKRYEGVLRWVRSNIHPTPIPRLQ